TGDTGPNDALWRVVNRIRNLKFLIIETAFSNKERHLAEVSRHLCPQTLAEELAKLERNAEVFITHMKPGEIEPTMQEIEECAGTEDARHALNRQKQKVMRTKAITDVDLLAVDDEVLDILATWDQVAAAGTESDSSPVARAMIAGAFSLGNLRGGAFSQLPAAHIEELLKRFEHVKTARGEVVIREGDEGDFYYVIESGRFQVERLVGGAKMVLA